jgi:hypothetical protein
VIEGWLTTVIWGVQILTHHRTVDRSCDWIETNYEVQLKIGIATSSLRASSGEFAEHWLSLPLADNATAGLQRPAGAQMGIPWLIEKSRGGHNWVQRAGARSLMACLQEGGSIFLF